MAEVAAILKSAAIRRTIEWEPTFTGTLYVHAACVDAVHEQIKEHVGPAWGPEGREWGTRELGLQDPDGCFITFTEPA